MNRKSLYVLKKGIETCLPVFESKNYSEWIKTGQSYSEFFVYFKLAWVILSHTETFNTSDFPELSLVSSNCVAQKLPLQKNQLKFQLLIVQNCFY